MEKQICLVSARIGYVADMIKDAKTVTNMLIRHSEYDIHIGTLELIEVTLCEMERYVKEALGLMSDTVDKAMGINEDQEIEED